MPKQQKYKTRDSKDLNTNYNHVNPDDLIEFDGTVDEFITRITHRKPVYMKKENGRSIIHWWWEDKDLWFMNHGMQRITKNERYGFDGDNGWLIATQIPIIFERHIREGYKLYLKIER